MNDNNVNQDELNFINDFLNNGSNNNNNNNGT